MLAMLLIPLVVFVGMVCGAAACVRVELLVAEQLSPRVTQSLLFPVLFLVNVNVQVEPEGKVFALFQWLPSEANGMAKARASIHRSFVTSIREKTSCLCYPESNASAD